MADISNARPLAIFTGYMVTAAALTATSIAVIRNGASKRRHAPSTRRRVAIALFSLLAAVSLATTWYHMFCFFRWSYEQWASGRTLIDPDRLHLGQWLRDTALFKQAWGETLETPPRAWWCLQIFGFCANWSVMLAVQEKKRQVPHLWLFMLLGQIVAISFASNMFFLAVLVYDQVALAQTTKEDDERSESLVARVLSADLWYDPIVIFTAGLAVNVPSSFGQPNFMPLLLAPHLLAFAPLLLNRLLPQADPAHTLNNPSTMTKLGGMVIIVGVATLTVVDEGGDWDTIVSTLHEHPAVSSVGWDVICCWVSYTVWHIFGEA